MQSDHHHLVLSTCNLFFQPLKKLGEIQLEFLDEQTLSAWFRKFPELKKSKIVLLLADDACQWVEYTLEQWQGDFADLGQDLTVFYIDACKTEEHWKIALLEQVSIEPYLTAGKTLGLKWERIAPVSCPELNFLAKPFIRSKQMQVYKALVLFGLPALAVMLCYGLIELNTAKLEVLQNQNRVLQNNLRKAEAQHSAQHLNALLPLVQQLLPLRHDLTAVLFDTTNEAELNGQSESMHALNATLDQLRGLPAFRPDSIQHLQIQSQKQGEQIWQLAFSWSAQS